MLFIGPMLVKKELDENLAWLVQDGNYSPEEVAFYQG